MKTKVNTYKANYKSKISYYTTKLNESLSEGNTQRMQKNLDSLNYFATKQIQIERMDEQVNEMIEKSNEVQGANPVKDENGKIYLEFNSNKPNTATLCNMGEELGEIELTDEQRLRMRN